MPNPYLRQRYGTVVDQVEYHQHAEEDDGDSRTTTHEETIYTEQVRLVPLSSLMPGGVPLDSSDDELMGTDASIGYANFPNAIHLMQTVFQPSRLLSRRVEEILDDTDAERSRAAVGTHDGSSTVHQSSMLHQATSDTDSTSLQFAHQRYDIEDLIEQTRAAMRAAATVVDESRVPPPEAPRSQGATTAADANMPYVGEVVVPSVDVTRDAPVLPVAPQDNTDTRRTDDASVDPQRSPSLHMNLPVDVAPVAVVSQNIGLNDSTLNASPAPRDVMAPRRIVLQAWTTDEASAAANRRLARRPPPPPPPPVQPQQVLLAAPKVVEAGKQKPRQTTRSSSSKSTSRSKQPALITKEASPEMIPVSAVESIFKSVYAVLAQQEKSAPTHSPTSAPATRVDPASLLHNAYAYSSSQHTTTVDTEHVLHTSRPFTNVVPAIPAARAARSGDISERNPSPSAAAVHVDSSSTLPRVGVSALAPKQPSTFVDVERPVTPKPTHPVTSRIRQPTESWKQRSLGPVHLKQSETIQHNKKSFPTVVNTAVSKQDQISHLNHSANRLLRHQSPQK